MKCTDCGSDRHNTGHPFCPDRGKGLAKPVVVNKATNIGGSVTEAKGSVTEVALLTKQERWRERNKDRYRETRREYMRKRRNV